MNCWNNLTCTALLACLPLTSVCRADDAPPVAPSPAPAGLTLAQALAAAEPPRSDVFLAVGAEKATLPKDAAPPLAGDTVSQVAGAYGRLTQTFETVTAIAFPTITVVYSPPDTPNPYDGMPPAQVLKLLSATFSKDQWKNFLGKQGIAYADMQGETQQKLFEALFPEGRLKVGHFTSTGPGDTQEFSGDQLAQAHLRLRYLVSLALPIIGQPGSHLFGNTYDPPDAKPTYFMANAQSEDVDHEFGATVREAVPNALKPSQLDYDAPALKGTITIAGVRTVDDLVGRIGRAVRLELYADARYGPRTVTLLGPSSARAKDLLRALAVCVGGTYRQVGPAYVLTDDVVGTGTRRALWKDFETKARMMLPQNTSPGQGTALPAGIPYTVKDISWGDDPVAFTADQQTQFWKQSDSEARGSGGILDLTLPFNRLSPTQQEAARQIQQANDKEHFHTTLDGTVMVQAEPEVEVTLPALDGPVLIFQSYDGLLPNPVPTAAEQEAQAKRLEAQFPGITGNRDALPPGPLRPAVQAFAHRAVRLAPKTAQELTQALTALGAVGFNEVWLQITPGATAQDDDASLTLLKQAVREAKKLGIVVLPDVRLLRWVDGTPAGLMDRDILGRTPTQAAKGPGFMDPNAHDTVTPFAPEVQGRLTSLLGRIGAVRGLGGMVWEDFAPSGYDASGSDYGATLGYAEAGRLTYLRWAHADPVDLYSNHYTDERAHVVVPGFNDDFNREGALYDKWRGLRTRTGQGLLLRLAALLPPAFSRPAARLPLIVPPANIPYTALYGSWDDLRRPPPDEQIIMPNGPDGVPLTEGPATERMPSAVIYHTVYLYAPPGQTTNSLSEQTGMALRAAARQGQRDIVMDATAQPDALTRLAGDGPPPAR